MNTAAMAFRPHAPWVHSLKEKISLFAAENCDAEIPEETREIK